MLTSDMGLPWFFFASFFFSVQGRLYNVYNKVEIFQHGPESRLRNLPPAASLQAYHKCSVMNNFPLPHLNNV